jgi:hypothetical protein
VTARYSTTLLITAQRDATQSSLFIILQVHSTCFGCQPRPSSGVHKTVTTASGTGHIFFVQLPPSNVAKLASGTGHIFCAATWCLPPTSFSCRGGNGSELYLDSLCALIGMLYVDLYLYLADVTVEHYRSPNIVFNYNLSIHPVL